MTTLTIAPVRPGDEPGITVATQARQGQPRVQERGQTRKRSCNCQSEETARAGRQSRGARRGTPPCCPPSEGSYVAGPLSQPGSSAVLTCLLVRAQENLLQHMEREASSPPPLQAPNQGSSTGSPKASPRRMRNLSWATGTLCPCRSVQRLLADLPVVQSCRSTGATR